MSGRKFLSTPVVPIVTALPGSPVDGQLVYYLADATNGVAWQFRYRAFQADGVTANPSAYKWEFVGGPPRYVYSTGSAAIASTAYGVVLTPGWTVPLPGDYLFTFGLKADASVSAVDTFVAIGVNGAPPNDALAIEYAGYVAPGWTQVAGTRLHTGLTAGQVIAMYLRAASGTAGSRDKFIEMLPVRVG